MIFNEHYRFKGAHAFLSASQPAWVNYDDEKLAERFMNWQAAARGTKLHEFAHQAITLGIKLPRTKATLNSYVNDGIGYRMKPEQILYYSDNCFGTADTIRFKNNLLRIHDLKTGVHKRNMTQLMVYDALFCLEYGHKPSEIEHELRIYQNDEVFVLNPDPLDIVQIMSTIKAFDKRIEQFKADLEAL